MPSLLLLLLFESSLFAASWARAIPKIELAAGDPNKISIITNTDTAKGTYCLQDSSAKSIVVEGSGKKRDADSVVAASNKWSDDGDAVVIDVDLDDDDVEGIGGECLGLEY